MSAKRLAVACAVAASMLLSSRPAVAADVTVNVNEAVLQKFLSTVGSVGVQGGDSTSVSYPYPGICWAGPFPYPCVKWGSCQASYSWSVSASNLSARIVTGAIPFAAQGHASASAGICGITVSASYAPALNGTMGAAWQNADQEIRFAMQHLNVEIYVRFLGTHVTLGWVDVARLLPNPLYRQKVAFAGSFVIPPPVGKNITVTLLNPFIALQTGVLVFTANLGFVSSPPPPA